jgi:hypothetical protein
MKIKDTIVGIHLVVEFDSSILQKNNLNREWLGHLPLIDQRGRIYCIDGKTDEFKEDLGKIDNFGCNQDLISHLKWARAEGAKWVIFYEGDTHEEDPGSI